MNIVLTCAMGLETVLKFELYDLGYKNLTIDNGSIRFEGTFDDVIRCNLWCRTAGRVFIELSPFKAISFDELFDYLAHYDWQDWLTKDAKVTIDSVTSIQSELFSKSDIQSITKKAIVTALKNHYKTKIIPETGYHVPIRIYIKNDEVHLRLDTSGHGLNKRGYRTRFDAPLRETLAAAIIKLSRWDPKNDALLDPFCGSGTILIEAAMMANNIAPGLMQTFCSEEWPSFTSKLWEKFKNEAKQSITPSPFRVYGSDINPDILKTARYNIEKVGLSNIFVETKDIADVRSRFDQGKIICNPSYGIRLEDQGDTHKLYVKMGQQLRDHFKNWHYYILSGDESFEDYFNKKATKKRKLFNGKIRCDLYQYF